MRLKLHMQGAAAREVACAHACDCVRETERGSEYGTCCMSRAPQPPACQSSFPTQQHMQGAGLLSQRTCANEWRLYPRSKARLWPTMGLQQSRIASITAAKPAQRWGGLGLGRPAEQPVWVSMGGRAERQGCGRRLLWCEQGRAEGAEFGCMAALMPALFQLPSMQANGQCCAAGSPAASWMASMRLRR